MGEDGYGIADGEDEDIGDIGDEEEARDAVGGVDGGADGFEGGIGEAEEDGALGEHHGVLGHLSEP